METIVSGGRRLCKRGRAMAVVPEEIERVTERESERERERYRETERHREREIYIYIYTYREKHFLK